jgi:hypothetical protein
VKKFRLRFFFLLRTLLLTPWPITASGIFDAAARRRGVRVQLRRFSRQAKSGRIESALGFQIKNLMGVEIVICQIMAGAHEIDRYRSLEIQVLYRQMSHVKGNVL